MLEKKVQPTSQVVVEQWALIESVLLPPLFFAVLYACFLQPRDSLNMQYNRPRSLRIVGYRTVSHTASCVSLCYLS